MHPFNSLDRRLIVWSVGLSVCGLGLWGVLPGGRILFTPGPPVVRQALWMTLASWFMVVCFLSMGVYTLLSAIRINLPDRLTFPARNVREFILATGQTLVGGLVFTMGGAALLFIPVMVLLYSADLIRFYITHHKLLDLALWTNCLGAFLFGFIGVRLGLRGEKCGERKGLLSPSVSTSPFGVRRLLFWTGVLALIAACGLTVNRVQEDLARYHLVTGVSWWDDLGERWRDSDD